MRFDRETDPDAALYDDLRNGSGELAARELMSRIKMFVCTKRREFSPQADEIALDIFERVCLRIDTFQWNCRFFSWVCAIAKNVLLERLREKL
jgi:DNA-directed RNA polymerase specialized sigma24 family protein